MYELVGVYRLQKVFHSYSAALCLLLMLLRPGPLLTKSGFYKFSLSRDKLFVLESYLVNDHHTQLNPFSSGAHA